MATANERPTGDTQAHVPPTKNITPLTLSTGLTTTDTRPLSTTATATTSQPAAISRNAVNGVNGHKPTPSADTTTTAHTTFTSNEESTLLSPASTTPTLEKEPPDLDFVGNIDVNDELPTPADLKRAGDLLILDANGQSRQFKELYTSEGVAPRQLIIFIRHFFCGNCQEYLRTLSSSLSPSLLLSLPTPTFISVIGCGSPSLIPMYAEATSCPFPIYAEPTRKLYDYLGMTRTFDPGSRKPEYMKRGMMKGAVKSIWQGVSQGNKALKGGDFKQVGGEFLFEEGECVKVHRMRNTRDHLEVEDVKKLLGIGEGELERLEAAGMDGSVGDGKNVKKRWSLGMKDREKEKGRTRSSSWGRVRAGSWKRDKERDRSGAATPEEKLLADKIPEEVPEKIPEEGPAVKAK